jgi:8-oxo-dGTP pyrophosphatase MutT (NUDIX family)
MSKTNEDIADDFNSFISRADGNQLVFLNKNVKSTFKSFADNFKVIEAAGGLIRNQQNHYLFIYRNGKWDLPKGKLDKGETPRKAAVRECEEECGINKLKIISPLDPTFHIYEMKGKLILKKTHWYRMDSLFEGKLIPQKEEGITKVVWADAEGIKRVKKNTFMNIIDVLNSAKI